MLNRNKNRISFYNLLWRFVNHRKRVILLPDLPLSHYELLVCGDFVQCHRATGMVFLG